MRRVTARQLIIISALALFLSVLTALILGAVFASLEALR